MVRRRSRISRSRGVGKRRTGRGLKGVTAAGFRGAYPRVDVPIFKRSLSQASGRRVRSRSNGPQTATRTRRRRMRSSGGGGQVSTKNIRFGKRRRMTFDKLSRLSLVSSIFRFQGVKRYGNVSGTAYEPTYPINNGVLGTAIPGFFQLRNSVAVDTVGLGDIYPFHIFDLTTMPNLSATTNVAWQMVIQNTSVGVGRMFFYSIGGQDPVAAETFGWSIESSSPGVSTNTSGTFPIQTVITNSKYIKTEWYDVRFVLYGQRQQPTFYDIMLVSFDEDYFMPEKTITELNQIPAEHLARRDSMYQTLIKSLSYNPIMPGAPDTVRGMRVMYKRRYLLQGSSTDDADRTPNHKIVKFFYRDSKIRNYDWGQRQEKNALLVDSSAYVQNIRRNEYQNNPMTKARVFMIVRASNSTPDAGPEDMDSVPSYDMVIRKKVRFTPSAI